MLAESKNREFDSSFPVKKQRGFSRERSLEYKKSLAAKNGEAKSNLQHLSLSGS
jgi:hypothetical protein